MKVVEYWHGTIKNYRYNGDISRVHETGSTDVLCTQVASGCLFLQL